MAARMQSLPNKFDATVQLHPKAPRLALDQLFIFLLFSFADDPRPAWQPQ
jgi:hypothetical protein